MVGGVVYLVASVIMLTLAYKFHDRKLMLVLFGLMSAFFLFGGLDLCTYHATVTLSATSQTFAFEEKTFYYHTEKTFPLGSLQEAVVRSGTTQNRQLTLLVASQPMIPLGDGYNSRANQFEAAHAVNAFIARTGQR